MLKLVKTPKKKKPADCTFEKPVDNQKTAVKMLMCCNSNDREYVIGPDVGLDLNVLVTKTKPNYYFNPAIVDNGVQYQDYLGNVMHTDTITEPMQEALTRLAGTRRTRKKTDAN